MVSGWLMHPRVSHFCCTFSYSLCKEIVAEFASHLERTAGRSLICAFKRVWQSSPFTVPLQTTKLKLQTSNLKPQTSNLNLQTLKVKPQTSNLKHQTSNLKHQTSDLVPGNSNLEPGTSHLKPSTCSLKLQTSNFKLHTFNLKPSLDQPLWPKHTSSYYFCDEYVAEFASHLERTAGRSLICTFKRGFLEMLSPVTVLVVHCAT